MARDDDIDYTILGLHILETYGFDFGPENVAREWLTHFPFSLFILPSARHIAI